MQIIPYNKLITATADSENTNYPASFVANESPKRVWKAADGVHQATITCAPSAGFDTIAIFNTNAEDIEIHMSDPNRLNWNGLDQVWNGITWPYSDINIHNTVESQGTTNAMWLTFQYVPVRVQLTLTFTALPNITAYCGVIMVGERIQLNNPVYGLRQKLKDYSVSKRMSNGSEFYDKKDTVRQFQGSIHTDCTIAGGTGQDYYQMMNELGRDRGRAPMAIRLIDNGSFEWVTYGRFEDLPESEHRMVDNSIINFSFIEVL